MMGHSMYRIHHQFLVIYIFDAGRLIANHFCWETAAHRIRSGKQFIAMLQQLAVKSSEQQHHQYCSTQNWFGHLFTYDEKQNDIFENIVINIWEQKSRGGRASLRILFTTESSRNKEDMPKRKRWHRLRDHKWIARNVTTECVMRLKTVGEDFNRWIYDGKPHFNLSCLRQLTTIR